MTFATATSTGVAFPSPIVSVSRPILQSSLIYLPRPHLRLSALRCSPSTPPEPKPIPEEKEGDTEALSKSISNEEVQELKERLAAARADAEEKKGFWGGVAEEVSEIEWPVFGKVLGTTGVVISVIAGSSIALLTVNAVFAEISDKIFVGRGVQDFLS